MYCPNCGANIKQGENFCENCGEKLMDTSLQADIYHQQNYEGNIQNNYNLYQTNNNTYNTIDKDDDLIDAYIGKKSDKFKNGGFSILTFLFGIVYILYRKMYLLGFIVFIISVVTSRLSYELTLIISLIIQIYLSVQFKKLYLKHVKEKIQEIKNKNPNLDKEQLVKICSQEGGVAIWPVVLVSILGIFYIIVMICALIYVMSVQDNVKNLYSLKQPQIDGLNIYVPDSFDYTIMNHERYYESYSKDGGNYNCKLSINIEDNVNNYSEQQYLESYFKDSDSLNTIVNKNINGDSWKYLYTEKNGSKIHQYVSIDDEKLFSVKYTIDNDNAKCATDYEKVINSLEID